MQVLVRREVRQCELVFLVIAHCDHTVVGGGVLVGGCDIAHEVRDTLLGIGIGCGGQFLIVFAALSRFAEYAAGMIDKPKRFFDVPLTVARLGIVFPDQTAQRRPHLLIGGKLWDS